jgi:hypothetical protein
MSSYESEVNAVKYLFQTENASGTERPGGVMWPYTPNGRIRIILSPSDSYHKETEKAKLGLKISWGTTDENTNHSSLSASESEVTAAMVLELTGATIHE